MSIATEIKRLQDAKEMIQSAIIEKGVNVPDTEKLDEYPDYILQIEGGGGEWHSSNPLCFTAEQARSTIKSANNRLVKPEISYDGVNWSTYTEGTTITLTNIGDKVYFRSKMVGYNTTPVFAMTGKISASGNPESVFEAVNGVLVSSCYSYMFQGCSALTTAPELPATTLADYCYQYMFAGCFNLTSVPELPATTLTSYCYQYMFQNCNSLTIAPALPATTLGDYCYYQMFRACSNLTSAPELPATTLTPRCYCYMFTGCTSLTTAPELPATTLATYCYGYMFQGCTSLTTAPELPATTLATYCYGYMFQGCTSLTTAPELPATTLASNCYCYMFTGCTSLTTNPIKVTLPATTLVSNCYSYMFYNCSSLNYIRVAANPWNTSYTNNWLYGVSSTGRFYRKTGVSVPQGASGRPAGWSDNPY